MSHFPTWSRRRLRRLTPKRSAPLAVFVLAVALGVGLAFAASPPRSADALGVTIDPTTGAFVFDPTPSAGPWFPEIVANHRSYARALRFWEACNANPPLTGCGPAPVAPPPFGWGY